MWRLTTLVFFFILRMRLVFGKNATTTNATTAPTTIGTTAPTTATTAPAPSGPTTEAPSPSPEDDSTTGLFCYGQEKNVTVIQGGEETQVTIDDFCITRLGNKTAKDKDGPCKLIDCTKLVGERLNIQESTDPSGEMPTSCFVHFLKSADGEYRQIHSCGPDQSQMIPYPLVEWSYDKTTGMDNGYLMLNLREKCETYEIPRDQVGMSRLCHSEDGGNCTAAYVSPGADGGDVDRAILNGSVPCPGRGLCMTKDNGTCECAPARKTCRYTVALDPNDPSTCEERIVRIPEIGPFDAVCDFDQKVTCTPPNATVGKCSCDVNGTQVGIGQTKLIASCDLLPNFKNDTLKVGMKQLCRTKEISHTGNWKAAGSEPVYINFCYCNDKAGNNSEACNGATNVIKFPASVIIPLLFTILRSFL